MKTACYIVLLGCLASTASGCRTFSIAPLKPVNVPPTTGTPFQDTIAFEALRLGAGSHPDAQKWEDMLPEVLLSEHVFDAVVPVDRSKGSEHFLLRGEVGGAFRPRGTANFFTWFPGPFVLAHGWRGTRFTYDARADLELVDRRTLEVVGRYHAETTHEMVHRSYNPGPIIGAALILPGVIKGLMTTKPSANYRKRVYEEAYGDLWEQSARQIAADRADYYHQQTEERRARCGGLDQPPVVSVEWSAFTYCQTRRFTESRRHPVGNNDEPATVYLSTDRALEIVVSDGRIAGWSAKGDKAESRSGSRHGRRRFS